MEIEDFSITADLQRLEASGELKELEAACLFKHNALLTELGRLQEGPESG